MKIIVFLLLAQLVVLPNCFADSDREAVNRQGQWVHQIKIINDAHSPVQINEANLLIRYEEPSSLRRIGNMLRRGTGRNDPRFNKYNHEVEVRSEGNSTVGVVYSVLLYDSFNKHIDGSNLVQIPFERRKLGKWGWFGKPSPAFHKYGMGCVFVRTVRLEDGSIWNFDAKVVVELLTKNKCGNHGVKETQKHIRKLKKDNPVVVF